MSHKRYLEAWKTDEKIWLPNRKTITEKQWLQQIVDLAKLMGWRTYHPWLSIRSTHGFPDLTLVRERLILVELKSETGKLSRDQQDWIAALKQAGVETYVWKPSDFDEAFQILSKRSA